MSAALDKAGAFAALPPPWPGDPLPEIRLAIDNKSAPRIVILDDDPTGTQTVRNLNVITCWDVETLRTEFASSDPGFFILTNSRSLTEEATRTLHREIATNLSASASGRPFTVISRSDSTLRGHFPAETDAIASVLGAPDLVVLAPYFEAGGRYTLEDEHYVVEGDRLIPAAETPFARDAVFGYTTSRLPEWVEEKSGGRVRASTVCSIPLEMIRAEGPGAVENALRSMPKGSVCIANACAPRDIEVVAAATLRLEVDGRMLLYRSAAAIVAARVGQAPQPPLDPSVFSKGGANGAGGLIVAGSYVPKTSAQLASLRARHDLESIELDVAALLDPECRAAQLAKSIERTNQALHSGRDVLAYTSRTLITGADAARNLEIGRTVSEALIHLVRSLEIAPRFLVAKGGITSSDVATHGLGVRRALVLGQIIPGVPVWRLGPEAKFPGMAYVVFPGNVGNDDALAEAVSRLKGV